MGRYEPKRSQDCLNLTKKNLRIIAGILIGHCRLTYYLRKQEIFADTVCRFYEEGNETSIHGLGKCPAFVKSRLSHLEECFIPDAGLKHLEAGGILKFLSVIG